MLNRFYVLNARIPRIVLSFFAGLIVLTQLWSSSGCSKSPTSPSPQGALLPTLSLGTAVAPQADVSQAADRPVETKTYDITAAVAAGVRINALSELESADAVRVQIDELLAGVRNQSVQQAAQSQNWKPATLRSDGDVRQIDVIAPASAHRHVQRLIEAFEQSGFGQIVVEVRFMSASHDLLRGTIPWKSLTGIPPAADQDDLEIVSDGVSGKVSVAESLPVLSAVVGPLVSRALVQEHQQDLRSNILFGPKITLRNGASGTVVSEVRRPFVTGLQISSEARQPQIQLLGDGTRMRLRPVFAADRQSIRIEGELEFAEILDVNSVTASMAGGPTSIQVPRIRRSTIQFAVNVAVGDSLAIQCPPFGDRTGFRYLVITPEPIPLSDAKW